MGKTIQLYGFSSIENGEEVKTFLEQYTGEGTVYTVEVGEYKIKSRGHAKVQFTDSKSVETILSMAEDQQLWYQDSYLKARELNNDIIISSPKELLLFPYGVISDITLHFGSQISEDKFSSLWKRKNVCVKFGTGLRKLYFFFSYGCVEYKLELSFENIWQMELHLPLEQTTKFLVLQLVGAPKIFTKDVSIVNYYKDVPDSCWVRDIDLTPSSSIAQSSALCLEIPTNRRLPDFREGFVYYKEVEGQFSIEKGSPFSSSSSKLVPIVVPPIDLPYKILFKINSLVQHGCLPGELLDEKFYKLVDPSRIKIDYIESALDKLYQLNGCCYDPLRWLKRQYMNYRNGGQVPKLPTIAVDDGLVYVHRVQITPSRVYFCGPEVNLSNRVLRNYANDLDNFLRLSFVDEDFSRMSSVDLCVTSKKSRNVGRKTRVYDRILSVLSDGIVIGEKRFEFLGFSSSQLRDNSVWMFASREGLNADDIRRWMGDFSSIRNVAKYAARLGQSFGSSRETLSVGCDEIELIPDIEIKTGENKYCFSDGIGKISEDFADQVAKKCGLNRFTPSAFQIRFGGNKGVVAIDPKSSMKLSLRNSMCKYKSENKKLDVLAWSKYQPCFLNRQLITLLSTLGVEDHVFDKKQKEAVSRLDSILTDSIRAQDELEMVAPGEITSILKEMLMCGYKPDEEPFLSMMLQTIHASKLLEIRTKTRIHIPNGRALMGCLDETGTLEYGQVFVQCSTRQVVLFDNNNSSSIVTTFVVGKKVVVAKNPCLHPGDIRVLQAVDVPELHHMVDCVVFPQKGERPHADECSGSDLDGDIYFVCWDNELIPPQQFEAMDYTPAPTIQLDHDVTIKEIQEYFTDYIVNDSLGIIANAHTVFADKEPKKAKSNQCIELAKLFSIAVDFPKTGVPAKIPSRLRAKEYPDFMEKQDKTCYESQHVIGKLFRQIKDVENHSSSIKSFTKEIARKCYDSDMEVDGFEDYIEDALNHKNQYDYKLGSLMDYYDIKTEAEILSGNVVSKSRHFNKKRDLESANYAVKALIKEARSWFNNNKIEIFDQNYDDLCAKKASAWYFVTYHPLFWGACNDDNVSRDHFLSFAWCVFDKLVLIKRDKGGLIRRSLNVSSLETKFSSAIDITYED